MNRQEILQAASKCVGADRPQNYGDPEDNFEKIANLWTDYLGYPIKSPEVPARMILLKIARISSGQAKDDNWVDIAGYAACGGEVEWIDNLLKGVQDEG